MSSDNQPPGEFTICGVDQNFVAAQTKIIENTIVVSTPNVSDPVTARYA
jgi:hypothetical protein